MSIKRQNWTGRPYGAAAPAAPSTGTSVLNLVSAWTDYFRNPYRQLAKLEADLQRAIATGRPQYEITNLQGQIDATKYEISRWAEQEAEISTYSQLGKVASGMGIVLMGAGVIYVLSKAAD